MLDSTMNLYLNKISGKKYYLREDGVFSSKLASDLKLLIGLYRKTMITEKNSQLQSEFRKILEGLGHPSNVYIEEMKEVEEPNAFCTIGSTLYYTKGLKKLLTKRELMAVLLHEYNHFRGFHVYISMIQSISSKPLAVLIGSKYMKNKALTTATKVKTFLLVLSFLFIYSIGFNITVGRLMEYTSDGFAAKSGYGDDLISGLKKLEAWYKKRMGKPGRVEEILIRILMAIDEHPSLEDRIEYILKHKKDPNELTEEK